MISNITESQLIYKKKVVSKIFLLIVSAILLGFNFTMCAKDNTGLCLSTHTVFRPEQISPMPSLELESESKKDESKSMLGSLNYLKRDHHLGFLECDGAAGSGLTKSKKMGLLFYAPRALTDCVAVHFSNEGIELTYRDLLDSSITVCSRLIEVNGTLFDRLCKEVEPLTTGNNRLIATYSSNFTPFFSDQSYGVEKFDDSKNGIVLVESFLDKTNFQSIDYAGFIFIKSTSLSTTKLVELIRHLANNTVQCTNAFSSALVSDNSLKPLSIPLGYTAYGYIKASNRYRLIMLTNSMSSVAYSACSSPVYKKQASQLAIYNPGQTSESASSTLRCDSKKSKKTAESAVQTESTLSGKNISTDYVNSNFAHNDSDDSSYISTSYDTNSSSLDLSDDDYELMDNSWDNSFDFCEQEGKANIDEAALDTCNLMYNKAYWTEIQNNTNNTDINIDRSDLSVRDSTSGNDDNTSGLELDDSDTLSEVSDITDQDDHILKDSTRLPDEEKNNYTDSEDSDFNDPAVNQSKNVDQNLCTDVDTNIDKKEEYVLNHELLNRCKAFKDNLYSFTFFDKNES